jgi:hypothetical protein
MWQSPPLKDYMQRAWNIVKDSFGSAVRTESWALDLEVYIEDRLVDGWVLYISWRSLVIQKGVLALVAGWLNLLRRRCLGAQCRCAAFHWSPATYLEIVSKHALTGKGGYYTPDCFMSTNYLDWGWLTLGYAWLYSWTWVARTWMYVNVGLH